VALEKRQRAALLFYSIEVLLAAGFGKFRRTLVDAFSFNSSASTEPAALILFYTYSVYKNMKRLLNMQYLQSTSTNSGRAGRRSKIIGRKDQRRASTTCSLSLTHSLTHHLSPKPTRTSNILVVVVHYITFTTLFS
jgi:hypothetical protein